MIYAWLIEAVSSLPTAASALETSISALESQIKTLEAHSNTWESALPWFTGAVALGVLMELWLIRHAWRDEMEAWALAYFGLLRSPSRPSRKKFAVEVVSVVLITLGIVGELWIGIEITLINGQLRSKSGELRGKSDQLVALLGKETAQLEHANLELKALIQPRDLTIEQQKAIGKALQRFSGKFVIIQTYAYDQESLRLATLIKAALDSGNIDTAVFASPSPGIVNLPIGVNVVGSDKNLADSLKKVLSDIGKLVLTDPKWKPQTAVGARTVLLSERAEQADIFVGAKPFVGQIALAPLGEKLHTFTQTVQQYKTR